ncbi:hypothetical protein [Nonomuraea turcica]|uniref:hypothetical protein n=1 Tax=Nonomuraea sp. G32 TaxID=3067274 RepID=UPI00273CDB5B|nr:hypothetical protein [Nonomuraea sp. G32]MDP4507612.1 hypothetical protein [Nonomuraea sp. G32]
MGKDLVRGAGVGLVVGLGLGYPVSRLYKEDIEAYTVLPGVLVGVLLAIPAGVLLSVALRIVHPIRSALLAPLLLLVLNNAVDLTVPSPRPHLAWFGFTVLAVVSYASAAGVLSTASPLPRLIAAVVVCTCVIMTATIEQRRMEARNQQHRRDLIASYNESLPLAVPDEVPGRTLVGVWTIADDVLALDYAKDRQSEPDVMVRISGSGDPRKECAAWEQDSGSCRRLSADRWLSETGANGRRVLFAKVGRLLVEVDSTALSPDEALAVGTRLRAVSAEYLVDFEAPQR